MQPAAPPPPEAPETVRNQRLLLEVFTVSALVFTGLFIRFLAQIVDPAVFGSFEAIVLAAASSAPLLLVGTYAAAHLGARVVSRTARRLREHEDTEQSTEDRARVFRGRTRSAQSSSALMSRESFMISMETTLAAADSLDSPFSLVILKLTLAEADPVVEFDMKRDVSESVASLLGENHFAGYLGNGIFAVGMTGTDTFTGQPIWIKLCEDVQEIVSERNGWLEETFLTAGEGEEAQALYGRALFSLRLATETQELPLKALVQP